MTNNFTAARLALIDALKANATLSANVRTWFEWGPGLLKRYNIEPSACPLVSVVPAELDEDQLANVVRSIPQDLEIGIATDGQDAAPCEELVCAALDVLHEQGRACLGLSSEGVTSIDVMRIVWRAVEEQGAPRLRWEALITTRINWMRRST